MQLDLPVALQYLFPDVHVQWLQKACLPLLFGYQGHKLNIVATTAGMAATRFSIMIMSVGGLIVLTTAGDRNA